jgi:hypothetical protein
MTPGAARAASYSLQNKSLRSATAMRSMAHG